MSEAKETIIIEDEPEDDNTEELYQSPKPRKRVLLPGSNISFYKQKFDCFLSAVKLIAFYKTCSQIYAVSFNLNSAVKTERNDYDKLIEILSSPETSPEKKR